MVNFEQNFYIQKWGQTFPALCKANGLFGVVFLYRLSNVLSDNVA